MGAVQCI